MVLFLLHPWLSVHQGLHLTWSRIYLCKTQLTKIVRLLFLVKLLVLSSRKMKGFSLTSIVVLLIFCMHKLDGYVCLFYISYTSIQYTYFLSSGASYMFLHVYFIWDIKICIFSKFRALNSWLLRDPNVCSFILQVVIYADTNSTLCSCLQLENNHKCLELIACTF